MNLIWLDECDSTQKAARDFLQNGVPPPFAVYTGAQSAGRGRQGHAWFSPKGGIYLSLVVPAPARAVITWAPLWVSLSILEWVKAQQPWVASQSLSQLKLKWPNDLVFYNELGELEKWGGVLCELVGDALIVGIGLNVKKMTETPESSRILLNGLKATALEQVLSTECNVTTKALTESLAKMIFEKFVGAGSFPRERVEQQFYSVSVFSPGTMIEWSSVDGHEQGKFLKLGDWGELIVELPNKSLKKLYSEEVKVTQKIKF